VFRSYPSAQMFWSAVHFVEQTSANFIKRLEWPAGVVISIFSILVCVAT
jgi:hypothetical protein